MKVLCSICGKTRKIQKRSHVVSPSNCHSCAAKLAQPKDTRLINSVLSKKCTICKQWKPFEHFGHNKSRSDGLENFCKECNVLKMRLYRQKHREKINKIAQKSYRNHKDRAYIRQRSSVIYPESCLCSIKGCISKGERHHPDYAKPDKIVWLCRKHHREEHSRRLKLI